MLLGRWGSSGVAADQIWCMDCVTEITRYHSYAAETFMVASTRLQIDEENGDGVCEENEVEDINGLLIRLYPPPTTS